MAFPARDHVIHLAELDAERLAELFRCEPSRRWDDLADAAWRKAADEVGLDDAERKRLKGVYLDALVAACARLCDEYYRGHPGG